MRQEKKTKEQETADAAKQGLGAFGRFIKAKPDSVDKLQSFSKAEKERKEKEEAEKKKKKNGVNTSPSKGILERMYDYVMGEKK